MVFILLYKLCHTLCTRTGHISTCSMSNDCHNIVSSGSSGATIEIVTPQIPKYKISFVGITLYGNFGHRVKHNKLYFILCNRKYQKLNQKIMGLLANKSSGRAVGTY